MDTTKFTETLFKGKAKVVHIPCKLRFVIVADFLAFLNCFFWGGDMVNFRRTGHMIM